MSASAPALRPAFNTRAVLFDLDGTLADTAPDMARALNALLLREGRTPLPLANIRPHVGSGARGMVRAGFNIGVEDPAFESLRDAFLDTYAADVYAETTLFPGMDQLLEELETAGLPWGVVTNKASRFTLPLLEAMGLSSRAACIVCGDTTAHSKPHPEPLLHACRTLSLAPDACLYVGDDIRDIQAARNAKMRVLAAGYGYLGTGLPPTEWQADAVVVHPSEIAGFL
jgi:N-acetyl-D-muramate 6-phosphate phosphatase